jgi:hypothetical protein
MGESGMNRHTKSPWRVSFAHETICVFGRSKDERPTQPLVATCDNTGLSVSERSANGLLIAAAPELLEAAKLAYSEVFEADPEGKAACALARAIAMAEGDEP